MLEFFRKYQSYIFLIVTVVIVISFSFFGTYNSIVTHPVLNQVVFTAVDGEGIRRNELDEMVMFINTDSHDTQLFGGRLGPNFLNNGVIRKDLLATGLAEILAANYLSDLKPDLESRLQKEKTYTAYKHPQAKFITGEAVWAAYAPKLSQYFKALQKLERADTEDGFSTRVQLFLNEMTFPAQYLRYVLSSQEKQSKFISHDLNLDHTDLSLFQYHTVEDWFGPRFVRLAAQFIINSAKIAEQKGYLVTKEEALADLIRNAQISYQQNKNNPNLGVVNSTEYYNEQLRLLGMDQNQAVKIWQQVLLFRRLFQDVGNAVFEDSLMTQNFNQYANEAIDTVKFTLPKAMQLADFKEMQKFEIYLKQISKRSDDEIKNLQLPKEFLAVKTVSKRNPELVQKRYLIKVSEFNKKNLNSKVSLKETWNFELAHFDLLKTKFPELAIKKSETNEDRLKALDDLDELTRSRVDQFARNEIIDSHPEWLSDGLEKARARTLPVALSKKASSSFFAGLESGAELMKQLDQMEEAASLRFTADNEHYYLITVLDKSANEEILTFAEANAAGILDRLLENNLKNYYEKEKQEKNWKSFDEEKDVVADAYFADLLKAIASHVKKENLKGQEAAPLRFFGLMQENLEQLKKNPESTDFLSKVNGNLETEETNRLPARENLDDQWKLQKKEISISRKEGLDRDSFFKMPMNSWTEIFTSPNGEISFFYLKDLKPTEDALFVSEAAKSAQTLLSNSAQKNYMNKVVADIKENHAISLDYLNQPIETMDVVPVHNEERLEV